MRDEAAVERLVQAVQAVSASADSTGCSEDLIGVDKGMLDALDDALNKVGSAMRERRMRPAAITNLSLRELCNTKCAMCGKLEEGWFVSVALEVGNTTGTKTIPAHLDAHLRCVIMNFPAAMLVKKDADLHFVYSLTQGVAGHK